MIKRAITPEFAACLRPAATPVHHRLWSSLCHRSALAGVEIKAAATWHGSFKKGLRRFADTNTPLTRQYVVYSGEPMTFSDGVDAVHYTRVATLF